MEIRLTKRGQALAKRVGKTKVAGTSKKSSIKEYTLIHIEIKNKRKYEWSEKVWVDENHPFPLYVKEKLCEGQKAA